MDSLCFKPLSKCTTFAIAVLLILSCFSFTATEAYDALDPSGNITIKWDVINWTPDGFVAVVTISTSSNIDIYKHRVGLWDGHGQRKR